MSHVVNKPFATIEDAQRYIALLAEAAAESKRDIVGELQLINHKMYVERVIALRTVDYALEKLHRHLMTSGHILADLRSLRGVLIPESRETPRVFPPPESAVKTLPAWQE